MPLIGRVSTLPVPPTESVTVMVVLVTAMLALVMSLPAANDTLPTPGLNAQFVGAVKINVLLVPVAMSPLQLPFSVMTMSPRVVFAGEAPFDALSVVIFVTTFVALI